LLSEIKTFLKETGDEKAELENDEWVFDLVVISDFIDKLSGMNLELQDRNKCIAEMMSTFDTLDNFPSMQDHLEKYRNFVFQTEKYVTEIGSVIQDFGNGFCDFQKIRRVVILILIRFKYLRNGSYYL
jgi:hypothetical protein